MHFALTEEHTELATLVRDLLRKRSDSAAVRRAVTEPGGYDRALWSVLCDQVGAAALAIPEEYGGAGYSLVETCVVLEELGAALTPAPLLGSAVLAAQALLLSGDEEACARLLPGIAAGETIGALVWAGPEGLWSPTAPALRAEATDEGWTLHGRGCFVLEGHTADVLLVVAATPTGPALFEVDGVDRVGPGSRGVRRSATPAMDQTLALAQVDLDGAPATRIGTEAAGRTFLPVLRDVAWSAVAVLQVAAAQRCLEMTVAYAKERVQFGRPIGSFQALKHRMADMLVEVETARSAAWAAAWSAAHRDATLPERAALARAWCTEALSAVAAETVQLHGGIAITWEHDAHLYFKRAHALGMLLGQSRTARARLDELWLGPASA